MPVLITCPVISLDREALYPAQRHRPLAGLGDATLPDLGTTCGQRQRLGGSGLSSRSLTVDRHSPAEVELLYGEDQDIMRHHFWPAMGALPARRQTAPRECQWLTAVSLQSEHRSHSGLVPREKSGT